MVTMGQRAVKGHLPLVQGLTTLEAGVICLHTPAAHTVAQIQNAQESISRIFQTEGRSVPPVGGQTTSQ